MGPRLEYSAEHSADFMVSPQSDDVGELVKETKREGADAIIDTSGNKVAINHIGAAVACGATTRS